MRHSQLFKEKLTLFEMVERPHLLAAILDRPEPDPDVAEFVNILHPQLKTTALHVAVEKNCPASSSLLVKAGDFHLKQNGEGFTPALEKLFQNKGASEITESLVKGLVEEIRMKVVHPEEALRCLKLEQEKGVSVLNLVDSNCWSVVVAMEGIGVNIAKLAPVMGSEFAEWLVMQTNQEGWDRQKIHDCLMEEDKDGKTSYDHLRLVDSSDWNKMAVVVGENVATLAANMGGEFADWLVVKATEEEWDRVKVYAGLAQSRKGGVAALSTLGMHRWSVVSMWKTKGLLFRLDNKQLGEAVQLWSKALYAKEIDVDVAALLVHYCVQKKGAVVNPNSSKSRVDLMNAVTLWNKENKGPCEYCCSTI